MLKNDGIYEVAVEILRDYEKGRDIDKMDISMQPDRDRVNNILRKLNEILFPGYFHEGEYGNYRYESWVPMLIEEVAYHLTKQISIALNYLPDFQLMSEEEREDAAGKKVLYFLGKIPQIRAKLNLDLEAFFDGDPAATGKEEVILSYPGFFATTVNRLAHELYLLEIPFIPRMMTEFAHSRTGIDIHPGAQLGDYFFMDHGTGSVIGETSVIGNHVKIYQGVTIGALSTKGGQKIRGTKRHPTIEDHVTIYAGASILGGETVIGHGSVIGSNVFITASVRPESRISVRQQELLIKRHGKVVSEEAKESLESTVWYYNI